MVLFIWKISQGLVSGYDIQFTSTRGQDYKITWVGMVWKYHVAK